MVLISFVYVFRFHFNRVAPSVIKIPSYFGAMNSITICNYKYIHIHENLIAW